MIANAIALYDCLQWYNVTESNGKSDTATVGHNTLWLLFPGGEIKGLHILIPHD